MAKTRDGILSYYTRTFQILFSISLENHFISDVPNESKFSQFPDYAETFLNHITL